MGLRISIVLTGLFLASLALAAEPVDNILPFQLTDDQGTVIAEIQVYEVSRQTSGRMNRPFVIIEGLDISTDLYGSFGRSQFESVFRSTSLGGGGDFWEILLNAGVDLYLVDFKSFDVTIENQSALLIQAMTWLWENRTARTVPFRVTGASMGGLIGRLALGLAEENNIDHHTSHFASLDSPHKGALIPLGIQGVLHFWSEFSSSVAELLSTLQWKSVKQVLLRVMTERESGTIAAPLADYTSFMDLYGRYVPDRPETMAFSNGSALGEAQISDPFFRSMFSFSWDPWGPGNFVVKITSFDQPPHHMVYNENYLGFFFTLDEKNYSANLSNIEAAPGGTRDTYSQLQYELGPALDALGHSNAPPATIVDQGQHCFIPLASAVDLSLDMTASYGAWELPGGILTSSFDRIYMASENTEHVDLVPYAIPLEAELLDTVSIDPLTPLFYDNGTSAPQFLVSPPIGAQVYYTVEITVDPALFWVPETSSLRNETNFFSSWWGGATPSGQGSMTVPVQDRAPDSPFVYDLPRSVMEYLNPDGNLFYRLRVFMYPDGSNAYATRAGATGESAPSLPIHDPGDIDRDKDVDGMDLLLFARSFEISGAEADMDNDTLISGTDMVQFGQTFGRGY